MLNRIVDFNDSQIWGLLNHQPQKGNVWLWRVPQFARSEHKATKSRFPQTLMLEQILGTAVKRLLCRGQFPKRVDPM